MPISSQWPVVVSFPFERSSSRPATAGAPRRRGQPSSGMPFPRPSASRFGRSRPPTAFATFPSVFEPSSPYSAASSNSPAPTASRTITHARGTRRPPFERACVAGRARRYSTAALDEILGLLLLAFYIVAVVGLAALITFAVIKIFPTQRNPKKPDKPEGPSSDDGAGAGRLF